MSVGESNRKTVFVLVHGDVWGAFNANQLLPELARRNCNIHLIVSRSTPNERGLPASNKVPDLEPFLELKETRMLRFFDLIDRISAMANLIGQPIQGRRLTFQQLAARYAADQTYHCTTRGGIKGGQEVETIFAGLAAKGIRPDLVLSGDTLAILPKSIVDVYDCFGTHPGPLPHVPGMHGTERSLIHMKLYTPSGRPYTGNRNDNPGCPMVQGSFFNLKEKLDDGPVISTALSPVIPGMSLCEIRAGLYYALISEMIAHLDVLLDPAKRADLLTQKKKTRQDHVAAAEVPDLTPGSLLKWTGRGVTHMPVRGSPLVRYICDAEESWVGFTLNQIYDPQNFMNWMKDFYPNPDESGGIFDLSYAFAFQGLLPAQSHEAVQVRQVYAGPNITGRLLADIERQRTA